MFRLISVVFMFTLSHVHADDCMQSLQCGKCGDQSEFSWNPANSYISDNLAYFYRLAELIESEYQNENFNEAGKHAKQYLNLATAYRCNWNHGNAIHDANRYLGLISIKRKDIDKAAEYLLRASQTPGSMQIDAFGPELDLANQLLKHGKQEEVITYLKKVDVIWNNNQQVAKWINKIEAGQKPTLQRHGEAQIEQSFSARYIY